MVIKTECTILAKGAPNQLKDGRIVMCAIALSHDIGLVRLYPFTVIEQKEIRVWSIVRCELSPKSKDNRHESYRVETSEVVGFIESTAEKARILNACELHSGDVDPIDYQNEKRSSICIVKPSGELIGQMQEREECLEYGDDRDQWMVRTQSSFKLKPMVRWTSKQGKKHTTHVLAQEVYEWLRKNPALPYRVFENLRLGDEDYEHWLILGNMANRRRVWVAPHIHRQKKIAQFDMLSSCVIPDGAQEDWPYLKQEEVNVSPVVQRMLPLSTTPSTTKH